MPCNTIQTVQVELGKMNAQLALVALTELGLNPQFDGKTIWLNSSEWIDIASGKSNLIPQRNVAQIKQAYSRQVVLSQAKRFGWQVTQKGNEFQLVRAGSKI